MEDRETARMRKYGESKTTPIMMAIVPHVTSGLGLRKFQADGILLTRVYMLLEKFLKKWSPKPILKNTHAIPQWTPIYKNQINETARIQFL